LKTNSLKRKKEKEKRKLKSPTIEFRVLEQIKRQHSSTPRALVGATRLLVKKYLPKTTEDKIQIGST